MDKVSCSAQAFALAMTLHSASEVSPKSSCNSGVWFQPGDVCHMQVDDEDEKEASVNHQKSALSSAESVRAAGSSKRSARQSVAGDFIRAETMVEPVQQHDSCGCPGLVKTLRKTNYVNNVMVGVVLIDAYCNAASIDARASNQQVPQAWAVLSDICLILYTLELLLQFYLDGISILRRQALCVR